jgi:preprotein translocase subunit SecG
MCMLKRFGKILFLKWGSPCLCIKWCIQHFVKNIQRVFTAHGSHKVLTWQNTLILTCIWFVIASLAINTYAWLSIQNLMMIGHHFKWRLHWENEPFCWESNSTIRLQLFDRLLKVTCQCMQCFLVAFIFLSQKYSSSSHSSSSFPYSRRSLLLFV